MAVMLLLSQQLYVWVFSLTPRFLCRLQETVFNSLASGVCGSFLTPPNAAVSLGAVKGKVLGFSGELKLKVEVQFFPGLHYSI